MSYQPQSYAWVKKGVQESDEDWTARNATVGLLVHLVAGLTFVAMAAFGIFFWATAGLIYALVPIGIGAGTLLVVALLALLMKANPI